MSQFENSVPEGTYVQLVQSLYRTLVPTSIIAVSFIAVGLVVSFQTRDPALTALAVLGSLAVSARVATLLILKAEAADSALSVSRASELERIFACSYLSFAAIFGLFCARAFTIVDRDTHVLVIALLVGYAAGVAAGIAYRPLISVAAIMLGVIPTIAVAFASSNPVYHAVGLLLGVFLVGGIQSMLANYRFASTGMTLTQQFANMAQSDALTRLPNRFGLGERFNQVTMMGRHTGDLAVHCLDLDRFKPVNDRYGHPVGDLLLQAVSERLERTLRGSDFVARVGGDEFVIVQSGIGDATEAELLARRIVRVISEPYRIGDLTITIGTSVGFALVSGQGHALDKLIAAADDALLRAKLAGGGCANRSLSERRTGS